MENNYQKNIDKIINTMQLKINQLIEAENLWTPVKKTRAVKIQQQLDEMKKYNF